MKTWSSYKEHVKSVYLINRLEIESLEMLASIVSEMIAKRNSLGISQRELAELCGIPQSSVARIETLKSTPKIDTLLKIMISLGIELKVAPHHNR